MGADTVLGPCCGCLDEYGCCRTTMVKVCPCEAALQDQEKCACGEPAEGGRCTDSLCQVERRRNAEKPEGSR